MTKMKIRNSIIAVSVLVVCVAVCVGVLFYAQANSGYPVFVYRFNTRTNRLEPERRMIPYAMQDEMVQSVINQLRMTPRNSNLRQAIPADLVIEEVRIRWDGVMEIDFPAAYNDMLPYEEGLFRASLVQTMTQLPFINIEGVYILVEGEGLLDPFGEPLGILTNERVLISPDIMPQMMSQRTLTLYFVSSGIDGLIPEKRTLLVPTFAVETAIIQELIAGPQQDGSIATIPQETRVHGVRTGGGICSINLTDEFISNFQGSQTLAELTLQSIIRSVMANDSTITSIQFLIDSQYRDNFNGVPYFDTLFLREDIERDEAG